MEIPKIPIKKMYEIKVNPVCATRVNRLWLDIEVYVTS